MPDAWETKSRTFWHLLYHSNVYFRQIQPYSYNLGQIVSFVHRTKCLELWFTMLMMSIPLTLISDFYSGASQIINVVEVRLVPGYSNRWSDNCQHPLANRLTWGLNGLVPHPLGFSVHPPLFTLRRRRIAKSNNGAFQWRYALEIAI